MSSVKFRKGDFKTYSAIESPDESTLYYVEDIGKIFKGSVDITSAVSFVTDREYISLIQGPVERIAEGKLYINLENNKILTRKKVDDGRDEKFEVFPGFLLSEEDEKLFDSNFLVTGNQVKNYVVDYVSSYVPSEIDKQIVPNPTLSGQEENLVGLQISNIKYKLPDPPATPVFILSQIDNQWKLVNQDGSEVTFDDFLAAAYDENNHPKECYVQYNNSLLLFNGWDQNSQYSGQIFRGNGLVICIDWPNSTIDVFDDKKDLPLNNHPQETGYILACDYNSPHWIIHEDQTARWDPIMDDTAILIIGTKTFTLTTNNTMKNWNGILEYSTDRLNWTIWTGSVTPSSTKLYLRGKNNTHLNTIDAGYFHFNTTGQISIKGNIEKLLDYPTVLNGEHPTMDVRCFYKLFYYCDQLLSAPELPATTLSNYCYQCMFQDCLSLLVAPKLPATTLAPGCYDNMFYECKSLTNAPILPATTLQNDSYQNMFANCTSLMTPPDLPATTLAMSCYTAMFKGCTALTTAPILPATTLPAYCYQSMFQDCASLKNAPELPATSLSSYCYQHMFQGCVSLTTPPALPATTVATYCYSYMFDTCISLEALPALPATSLVEACYLYMFANCTKIKLSNTQTEEYQNLYRIPSSGTGTQVSPYNSLGFMFNNTGGPVTGTGSPNHDYYTTNTIINI